MAKYTAPPPRTSAAEAGAAADAAAEAAANAARNEKNGSISQMWGNKVRRGVPSAEHGTSVAWRFLFGEAGSSASLLGFPLLVGAGCFGLGSLKCATTNNLDNIEREVEFSCSNACHSDQPFASMILKINHTLGVAAAFYYNVPSCFDLRLCAPFYTNSNLAL